MIYSLLFVVGTWLPPTTLAHIYFGYFPPIILAAPLLVFAVWLLAKFPRKRFSRYDRIAVVGLLAVITWGLDIRWHPFLLAKRDLRVMTFNVEWHTGDGMPELNKLVKEDAVDVVLLQEVTGDSDNVAVTLQKAMPGWSCEVAGETAILSRWPLSDVRKVPLTTFGKHERYILSATVQAPHPFRALTLHWTAPDWAKGLRGLEFATKNQAVELALTLKELQQTDLPVVFGGDFNCPPRHAYIQQLSRAYTNAFSAAGNGPGWNIPSDAPILRIDHLFSSPQLDPVRAVVGPSCGSDHRSLLVDYAWRAP